MADTAAILTPGCDMVEARLIRFYDDEAVGALEIDGAGYEYIPTPAAELRPDESARVLIGKTAGGRRLECYWVRSYFDGRAECDCLSWKWKKAATWGECKHIKACRDYGLIRESEEPAQVTEVPF